MTNLRISGWHLNNPHTVRMIWDQPRFVFLVTVINTEDTTRNHSSSSRLDSRNQSIITSSNFAAYEHNHLSSEKHGSNCCFQHAGLNPAFRGLQEFRHELPVHVRSSRLVEHLRHLRIQIIAYEIQIVFRYTTNIV